LGQNNLSNEDFNEFEENVSINEIEEKLRWTKLKSSSSGSGG
jgi:hypothetical protein